MDCVDYIYIQKNVSYFYIADPSVFFFGKWPPWVSSTKINFFIYISEILVSAVALSLVRSILDGSIRVTALVEDIVLCSWLRQYLRNVFLHPGV